MPTLLSLSLLDEFESRLRAEGLVAVRSLASGLTDAEIDALTGVHGIELPEEARVWWRWHNGSHAKVGDPAWYFLPFRQIFTLEYALSEYADERCLMREANEPEALLRPVGEKPVIHFCCAGVRDEPVPIYGRLDWASPPSLRLPSIGELVLTWLEYIDRGLFDVGADGAWRVDPDREVPADVLRLAVY